MAAHLLEETRGLSYSACMLNFFCPLMHVTTALNVFTLSLYFEKRPDLYVFISGFQRFKKPYLTNRTSEFKSIFMLQILTTRSLKLDPSRVCFDEKNPMPTLRLYGATLVMHCATLVLHDATVFQNQIKSYMIELPMRLQHGNHNNRLL